MSQFILTGFADEIDVSLSVQMSVMESLGIKYIEMRNVNGKSFVNHTIAEVKEIKRQLDEKGINLSAIGSPIGKVKITDPFEPHLDLFKHTLDIAAETKAPYIRMFSFFIPQGDDPAIYRNEVLDRWYKFLTASLGYDVYLLHENEKDIYGDTALRCYDLLSSLNSERVGAIFDPANFIQCNTETYPHAYDLLKDYIKYFHIKDACANTGKPVPSGEGDGKLFEILSAVYKNGFNGFLSIEPHLGSYEQEYDYFDKSCEILPEGGPKKFQIATDALKRILNSIEPKTGS